MGAEHYGKSERMFLDRRDKDGSQGRPYPWDTMPSNLGSTMCDWCGRHIYAPAVPCSVEPVAGLADMETGPGLGDRCKWELATRTDNAGKRGMRPMDRLAPDQEYR